MVAFPPLSAFFSAMYWVSEEVKHFSDVLHRIPTVRPVRAYTHLGYVTGTRHRARGGMEYSFFRGIPYAEPPVGDLRFEPPLPHSGWTGYRSAKYWGSPCCQINIIHPYQDPIGSEDCLTLNVATRRTFVKGQLPARGYRPVMVWIYGGFFMVGDASLYSPKYIMEDDVVFVSMNYRLASFGFLNTGDGVVAGNMGLKDQSMAIKWVKNNIKYFNGDPERITIFGQSAGSVSVHMHTMSPMSQGLFSGAISISGTALCPWALKENVFHQTRDFAIGLGCPYGNSTNMVACLKSLPARTITAYHIRYIQKEVEGEDNQIFGPTVDSGSTNIFLPARPLDLLKQGKTLHVPWLAGVDSGDGLVFSLPVLSNKSLLLTLNENWDILTPKLMFYAGHEKEYDISEYLRKTYLNDFYNSRLNIKQQGELYGDRGFYHDLHKSAIYQSKNAHVFLYYYNHYGLFNAAGLAFQDKIGAAIDWAKAQLNIATPNDYGVCHGDEVSLLFHVPFVRKQVDYHDRDIDTSRRLVRLFTSFAELGKPSLRLAGISGDWPSVKESNPSLDNVPLKMIMIENKRYTLIDEPYFDRIQFWEKYGFLQ